MKPDPAVYESIPPLPPDWRKQRKKGMPEVYTAYCSGCGRLLPLERTVGLHGVDESGRPFYRHCLFCEEKA